MGGDRVLQRPRRPWTCVWVPAVVSALERLISRIRYVLYFWDWLNRFRGVVGVVHIWLRCVGKDLVCLLCAGTASRGRPGVIFGVQRGVI